MIGGSLLLYACERRAKGGARFGVVSRETLLLVNNMLLAAACATVLLGTLVSAVPRRLGLGKISVGPPYFATVFTVLMAPLHAVDGRRPADALEE